jgi:hypothetical protein
MVIVFSNLAIAENFRANIRPEIKDNGSISTGELISVIIEIELPSRDYNLEKILLAFKKNITNKLLGPLFLTKIIDQGYSKYNKSVFIMKATAVVYNNSKLRKLTLNITNHSFLVKIKMKNIIDTNLLHNKSIIKVYDTEPDNNSSLLYMFLSLMTLVIVSFAIYKKRKKLLASRKVSCEKKLLINSIKSAESRFDLEALYANRMEIIKILANSENYFDDLFTSINKNQYLKKWNDDLLEDILSKKNILLQKINNG